MANVLTPAGGIFRRPRGGRPQVIIGQVDHRHISIHALREEGDRFWFCCEWRRRHFYPHPPRGERQGQCAGWFSSHRFLSTPSARRATGQFSTMAYRLANFYPRPPRGGRRRNMLQAMVNEAFLSTPSARRATRVHRRHRQHHNASPERNWRTQGKVFGFRPGSNSRSLMSGFPWRA